MSSQGIVLTKGGRINLAKEAPSLKKVRIALGWKPNPFDTGEQFDLDASVFVCKDVGGESKLVDNDHLVFYGNTQEPTKAVLHHGDNRTGDAEGDDEVIDVILDQLPAIVNELSIIVTIYDADGRKQNFGQVSNSYVRLLDADTNAVLATYDLEDDFSSETAVQFGSLYRKDAGWAFKAVGAGFKKGLADFVVAYGGTVSG